MKVYVCSSWRNQYYYGVLSALESAGHKVWDWREPPTGDNGFSWTQTGLPGYQRGDKVEIGNWISMLEHPVAQAGFASDLAGMNWCDVGVLLHPCGKSAHLEAGWLAGRGKAVHMLVPEPVEPDLMILALNGRILKDVDNLLWVLKNTVT